MWGALAFMLNFIPHVGSTLAAVPPILVAILKFDTYLPAIGVTLSLLGINIILGSIIEPRLMGQRLSCPHGHEWESGDYGPCCSLIP
ncbi:MAG: AI-2E family transporter [Gammaproteobacteria bacterium]|nr:AI-2E family transporter [Gammaproteobacteria bacterium]